MIITKNPTHHIWNYSPMVTLNLAHWLLLSWWTVAFFRYVVFFTPTLSAVFHHLNYSQAESWSPWSFRQWVYPHHRALVLNSGLDISKPPHCLNCLNFHCQLTKKGDSLHTDGYFPLRFSFIFQLFHIVSVSKMMPAFVMFLYKLLRAFFPVHTANKL